MVCLTVTLPEGSDIEFDSSFDVYFEEVNYMIGGLFLEIT
jgi:hypothetical protein